MPFQNVQEARGKAEGKIETLEATRQAAPPPERNRSWWARLFGGGE